jgi:ABC-2 type transport system permease protein
MFEKQASASSIYDLGYRHYDGPRTGRWGTFATLYTSSVRSAFGIGRRTSSKIIPFTLAVFAFIPALIQVGIGAITSGLDADVEIFEHEDYFGYVQIVLVLFCAAVAPELVGRDQRSRMLSLYFSRALARSDYALARFAALTSVMLVLTLGPQAVLFVGNGMAADDLSGYIADRWDLVFPIIGGSVLVSAMIASVGLVIASYMPRRAYATAVIVGAFVLTFTVATILMETLDTEYAQYALLVSPAVWDGVVFFLFQVDASSENVVADASFSGWVYLAAGLATIAVALGLTVRRFQRIQA